MEVKFDYQYKDVTQVSEIIKRIEAHLTGQRYAQEFSPSLLSASLEMNKPVDAHFLTEYFVGVKLGHKVRIDESVPNQKEEALRVIRNGLTELIFGEFRTALAKAGYNLYNRDFEEARKAIEEIERKMFYD